jgi:hypothetical protein
MLTDGKSTSGGLSHAMAAEMNYVDLIFPTRLLSPRCPQLPRAARPVENFRISLLTKHSPYDAGVARIMTTVIRADAG